MDLKKVENKSQLINSKKRVLKDLDNLITEYMNSSDDEQYKQAANLVYWFKDFKKYMLEKSRFNPNRLLRYSRGQVIKVNFGFNVGHEEGGLHYAIVIDNKNAKSSGLITVIPLTSVKFDENGDIKNYNSKYDVKLDDDLYEKILDKAEKHLDYQNEKYDNFMKVFIEVNKRYSDRYGIDIYQKVSDGEELVQIKEEMLKAASGRKMYLGYINHKVKGINNLDDKTKKEIKEKTLNLLINQYHKTREYEDMLEKCQKELITLKEGVVLAKKIYAEVNKMKQGSIALVGQITTVSKQRIYDPRTMSDVFPGVKISHDKMDEINKKIKELYVFE